MKVAGRNNFSKSVAAMLMMAMILPLAAFGQTRISMPRNKYKVEDDIKLGRDAAAQVEKQMPILNDYESTRYIQSVGQRLVSAIPSEFQEPQFQYTFKIVNAKDINAFALPGGPMFVNRGMIEAAKNEGEMAGVMAHEISHVALRHGTAQATKQGSFGNQLGTIGLILGGAILGGNAGAQLGALGAQVINTRYSREFETQADVLGAQIMARAGYDPRDLANMFQTIQQQSGGSGAPEWISSHPDPGNRFNNINREAQLLRVSPEPIKITAGFQSTQSRLRGYAAAPSSSEIERNSSSNQGSTNNGTYSRSIPAPSTRSSTYNSGGLYINYPSNWRSLPSQDSVMLAPEGAYGNNGISHGVLISTAQGSGTLQQATDSLVRTLAQQNGYQTTGSYYRTTLNGRSGLAISARGQSNITGEPEAATIYTSQLSNGNLLYVVTVAPQSQASSYSAVFSRIVRSITYQN